MLELWNTSIPVDDNFKESIGRLTLDSNKYLLPVKALSAVFPNPLNEEHLHVVVKLPYVGECCTAFRIHICLELYQLSKETCFELLYRSQVPE